MERSKLLAGILVSITSLVCVMRTAAATQPPDEVVSDSNGNTASGTDALVLLVGGLANSAFGQGALLENATGNYNTALGASTLSSNTTGADNTAVGLAALESNNVGDANTAAGVFAMAANSSGSNNTALGAYALYSNTTGKGNAAQGVNALRTNMTGIRNLGIGNDALYNNVSGSYNIALGFGAGYNATGNDTIYLANEGVAGESQTLRLGTQGSSGVVGSGILSAYIAGVATSQVTGSAVYITSSGQLGVLASSERFKTDVQDMGTASEKLAQLRPVTFRLKTDPTGATQYGLIAEEVAKVYPELVIHGADRRIDGVRYEELAPMLLSVVQRQQEQIAALTTEVEKSRSQAELVKDLQAQVAQLSELTRSMMAGLREAPSKEPLLAQRAAD